MVADTACWLELADFNHCEPTSLAFRALIALLDAWPGADQEAAIAYAEDLLKKWPDSVRIAPWSWCKAASKGVVLPSWRLVRSLQLEPHHLSKGKVNLARLAHYARLDHITELKLPRYSNYHEVSFLYHRPEAFPTLKTLKAVDKFKDGNVGALANSPLWQTLENYEIEDLNDSLSLKYLKDSDDFHTLNILLDTLTPQLSGLVYQFMQECATMVLPMAIAASEEVALTVDCDWPRVEIIPSASALHKLLVAGPYHRWSTQ